MEILVSVFTLQRDGGVTRNACAGVSVMAYLS